VRYHVKAIMTIAIAGAALMQNSVVPVDAASAAQGQRLRDNGTAAKVTLTWWTWTTNPQAVIANFERAHPNINVQPPPSIGAGSPFLSKLITDLENGTGPCLTQVPYYNMPQFMASKSLDNITQYATPEKALFPGWTWAQVSQKGQIYGIPEDIGPMGLMYQPALFTKYHLAPPKTWSEFASDAVSLHKDNPSLYMDYFAPNDTDLWEELFWQAGANPFHLQPNGTWSVNLTGPVEQKVVNLWGNLVRKGAIAVDNDFTADWGHHVADGRYAAMVGGAWSPTYQVDSYLPVNSSQSWAVTQIPQWTAGADVSANDGGSANAVTKDCPAADVKDAVLFASWINSSKSGLTIDEKVATPAGGGRGLFPAASARASVAQFNAPIPHFQGDPNAVFARIVPTVRENFEWSPWDIELGSNLSTQLEAAANGRESFSKALSVTQSQVVSYARSEGYSVVTG
jgi:multiple sugar transport system substrate-binding protein